MTDVLPCAACGQPLQAIRVRRNERDYHPHCDPEGRGGKPVRETVPLDDRGTEARELKERELRG